MHRNVFCSIALVILTLFAGARFTAAQRTDRVANSDETRILSLINRERSRKGLSGLEWSDDLANVARSYSQKMAREHFFAHVDSNGNDVVARARRMRVRGWAKIGENLFMCSPDDNFTTVSVRGWMRSPTHRENILDPEWRTTGIGIAYARNGDIYITEVFADN
jgi:uncharacterized protein YkwD